jgi:anaerobic magnesium-protoporphyrin IX monomethyl ester cyclase
MALNMKHALLVWPGKSRKYGPAKSVIPLQLLFLSNALSEVGIPSHILDLRLETADNVDLNDVLFVGISTYSDGTMIAPALDFARKVKTAKPLIPLIWGGVHPSLMVEQTLQNPYVDIIVHGEGENTVKELALAIMEGSSLSPIQGIAYQEDGEIRLNPPREFIDMDTLNIALPYHLLDINKYIRNPFSVHTSRGCPFKCGFCYNTAFNKLKWRCKSSEKVLDEIEYIVRKFRPEKISFIHEDEFFIKRKRVEEICEGLLKRGIKIGWESFCRLDNFAHFDDDFIKLLERSGCERLSFGAESGSQRILDFIEKGIKVEHILTATEKIAKSNIKQAVSFVSGFPTETFDDMVMTCNLIDELARINPKIWVTGIFYYTPFPGSPLFELVIRKYNYKPPGSLEEWGNFRGHQNIGKITWHRAKYAQMMQGLTAMTYLPFYTDDYNVPEHLRIPFGPILRFFHTIARIRWKRRFFKYPFEWSLFGKGKQFLKGGNL